MSERSYSAAATVIRGDTRCDWRSRHKRPHCECKCVSTDQPPKRPDPAIYSQRQRLSQGLPTSWESPDIQTNWWDSWRFMDSIQVRAHNESNEASAVNTLAGQRLGHRATNVWNHWRKATRSCGRGCVERSWMR